MEKKRFRKEKEKKRTQNANRATCDKHELMPTKSQLWNKKFKRKKIRFLAH